MLGTVSLRISSRLLPSSLVSREIPVRLPPGRARLSTRPVSTGSAGVAIIITGIVLVAFFTACRNVVPPAYEEDINFETHELGRKLRLPIAFLLRKSVLDNDVPSFYVATYVATLAQSQPN